MLFNNAPQTFETSDSFLKSCPQLLIMSGLELPAHGLFTAAASALSATYPSSPSHHILDLPNLVDARPDELASPAIIL